MPVPCNVSISCSSIHETFKTIDSEHQYTPKVEANSAISDGEVWEFGPEFDDLTSCTLDLHFDVVPDDAVALLVDNVTVSLGLCEPRTCVSGACEEVTEQA
jgi:hypothetical protein